MATSVHPAMSLSQLPDLGVSLDCIDPALLDKAPMRAPTPIRASPAPKAAFLETNAEASSSSVSSLPTPPRTPSRPPSRTERRFKCQWEGCDKAYFKPARLREHELSHTGERPHACPNCDQTYLRATHLAAHMRVHKSDDQREFKCPRPGCGKAFWTATHLKRHEKMHDSEEIYECQHCDETFAKAHLLRDHVVLAHMPPGTKPYPCTHEGCDRSFALKQHLKAHEKTHDPTRYTCSHLSHGTETLPSFPTWSALQAHIHEAHPTLKRRRSSGGQERPAKVAKKAATASRKITDESKRLTGAAADEMRRHGCPAHATHPHELPVEERCASRFWRVYDVRRHLKSEHALELEDAEVRTLLALASERDAARTAATEPI